MKTASSRSSLVRRFSATSPVAENTTIPSIEGWPGWSDEITLQPGEWLELVNGGSPERWSEYVIRSQAEWPRVTPAYPLL